MNTYTKVMKNIFFALLIFVSLILFSTLLGLFFGLLIKAFLFGFDIIKIGV